MVDDYMLNKVLGKIKEIAGIEKFVDANILVDTNDKSPDDIAWENVLILIPCVTKDDGKFYPQMFLEESLLVA